MPFNFHKETAPVKWAPARRNRSKGKTWCGPYALAVIANIDYEPAYLFAKNILEVNRILGMYHWDLSKCVKAIGAKVGPWKNLHKITVARLADNLKPNRLYIVRVTGHYIVVDTNDWTVCDNQVHSWVPLSEWKHRRTRVKSAAEILKAPSWHDVKIHLAIMYSCGWDPNGEK